MQYTGYVSIINATTTATITITALIIVHVATQHSGRNYDNKNRNQNKETGGETSLSQLFTFLYHQLHANILKTNNNSNEKKKL